MRCAQSFFCSALSYIQTDSGFGIDRPEQGRHGEGAGRADEDEQRRRRDAGQRERQLDPEEDGQAVGAERARGVPSDRRGIAATEPAMISVMKGIDLPGHGDDDAERPVVAHQLRQLQAERAAAARDLAAAIEEDHDDEGGDDRRHDERYLVERREQPLAGKALLQGDGERHGDRPG